MLTRWTMGKPDPGLSAVCWLNDMPGGPPPHPPPPHPPLSSPTCHYFVPWRLWTSTHSGHQQLSSDLCTVWAWEIFFFQKIGQKFTTDAMINLWDMTGFVSTSGCCTVAPGLIPGLAPTVEASSLSKLNMELDLQSLFGLLCTAVLFGWDPATLTQSPRIWAHLRGRFWSGQPR